MKENMPGRGYSQGIGMPGKDLVQRPDVDMGPKKGYVPPKGTRPYAWTTFDAAYSKRVPTYIRNIGEQLVYPGGYETVRTTDPRGRQTAKNAEDLRLEPADLLGRRMGYGRPAKDEPYLNALHEFFAQAIDRMPAKVRQDLSAVKGHLRRVMYDGRSLEDQAKELGISKQAVHQAQQRAIAQLVEVFGDKHELAKELRRFLRVEGLDDGWLPRWVW